MRKKSNTQRLTKLGGPEAGSVAALAVGRASGDTIFVGTQVGVYRSIGFDGATVQRWERLPTAPLGVLAVAVSPNYAADHTLAAGTNAGLFISTDSGASWVAAQLPIATSAVIALSFSPNYAHDGLLIAGTLEDGIVFSNTRGERWGNRSFGLLDATVLALAFSPNFAHDQTAFAATDTAVYHSYNGTLAWQQLAFPDDAAPALSLAVSPNFENDATLYVGTETQGLYRSTDRGDSWQRLDFPATCVNAVLVSPTKSALIAATEAGVFTSPDDGETWQHIFELENVISLVATGDTILAGLVEQGAWLTTDLDDWQPLPNLSSRSLVGLVLSPQFQHDGLAFMFGPQESLWKTADGGATWTHLRDRLRGFDVTALVPSPNFADDHTLVAASPGGLLLSTDTGEQWYPIAAAPATRVAFSPNGKMLAASFTNGGIGQTEDFGKTWRHIPGAWDVGGVVAALAVTNSGHYTVALFEGVGETVSFWQGAGDKSAPDQFEKVLRHAAGKNPVVALYVPSEPAPDRPWYASLGNRVWKFSSRKGRTPAPVAVFEDADAETLLSLTSTGQTFLAHTGQHVYKSADAQAWTKVYDFGNEPAVSLAVSPDYLNDKKVYMLILGGYFCEATIR